MKVRPDVCTALAASADERNPISDSRTCPASDRREEGEGMSVMVSQVGDGLEDDTVALLRTMCFDLSEWLPYELFMIACVKRIMARAYGNQEE